MAVLEIPDQKKVIRDHTEIRTFLNQYGVVYEVWQANEPISADATQEQILAAYSTYLQPLMRMMDYKTADVIRIKPNTPNLDEIRHKFLREHTHSEDEVRFFIEGKGYFWFNLGGDAPVFAVLCEKGDLISVPTGSKHWFDMGAEPNVTAIRVFTDVSGWVANYTQSGVDAQYNKPFESKIP